MPFALPFLLQKKFFILSASLFILLCGLVALPSVAEKNKSNPSSFLKSFGASDEFLDADNAFKLELDVLNNKLFARWIIADGYYLYKDRLEVFKDNNQKEKINVQKQIGKLKSDPFFGESYVFYKQTEIELLPQQLNGLTALTFKYQGCADKGVCYPPQTKTVNLQGFLPLIGIANTEAGTLQAANIVSDTDTFSQQLLQGNLLITLGLFFVAGLLLSFTPCVLPMIPILSGTLASRSETINTQKAFRISLVYVSAVTLTYTVAGVVAALLGENLQIAFQKPWVLVSFSLIFVALALSMFGFFNLGLPQKLANYLANISKKQKKDSYIGVLIMGVLSALVIGPCVSPPLAGALLYIGQTGDSVLGGSALFMLSLGMNLPLLLFGTVAGKWLPKSGAWMTTINRIFGIMLLAVAIWILDRVIPIGMSMVLWSTLLIITAVYMGAFEGLRAKRGWSVLSKGISWVFFTFGVLLLVGAMSGGQSVIQPLKHLAPGKTSNNSTQIPYSYFRETPAGLSLQQALISAKSKQKPSMLYVTAAWCVTCKELDLITFENTKVIKAMGEDIIFKVDITKNTNADKKFRKSTRIIGPPAIIFYDSNGEEIRNFRVISMILPDEFIKRIKLWQAS